MGDPTTLEFYPLNDKSGPYTADRSHHKEEEHRDFMLLKKGGIDLFP